MPYRHYHDGSFHTHRQRRKGGGHYNAVRRQQRPWRIGTTMVVIGAVVAAAVMLGLRYDAAPDGTAAIVPMRYTTSEPRPTAPTRPQSVAQTFTAEVRSTAQAYVTITSLNAEARVAELEQHVHRLINQQRTSNGSPALEWDDRLAAVARAHSHDMDERGFFDHRTPEGLDPTDRLNRAGHRCRKGYRYGIAENIAVETNLRNVRVTADNAVQAWMRSPGHRKNILSREYDTTGVGAAYGNWRSGRGVYLTQVFC